jgi:hypothetical protein
MNSKARKPAGGDTVTADRPLRWRVLALFAVLIVVLLFALFTVRSYLQKQVALSATDPVTAAENVVGLLWWLTAAVDAGLLGCTAWFGWLGTQVLRSGQYPPPGAFVLRDTHIRRGAAARCTGVAALLFCALLLLFGTYGAWRFQYVASKLVHQQLTPLPSLAEQQ